MITQNLKKALAGSALAVLLMPMAASAHGLSLGGVLSLGADKDAYRTHVEGDTKINFRANGKTEHEGKAEHEGKVSWDKKGGVHASTTAAVVTKKANRIKDVADFMGSIGALIEAKIGASGSTTPAVVTASADYKTQLAAAKTQAQTALTAAATVNAGNSTTTNASIVAQAQASLKAAQDFLAAARADLKVMLKFLWR